MRPHGRAMPPAGASEGLSQIALALAPVKRNQEVEQTAGLVDGCLCVELRHHVVANARDGAVERAQLGDEERME